MHRRIGRQGGWVGLIVILLALVIVAWLSKDALKQYGLMDVEKQPKATSATDRVLGPGVGVTGAAPDLSTATPAPLNALERARGVEGMVKEQAAEQARRIDAGTK